MTSTIQIPAGQAARHGTGDIDLSIMIAAHNAFRRDLIKMAAAADGRMLREPVRRLAIANGWDTFKRQLLQHHQAEDACLWPPLRDRLADSAAAMEVLKAMEDEHALIDPLLEAVEAAFDCGRLADGHLGEVISELTSKLTGHLAHEERDTLPLIGLTLTMSQWAQVQSAIRTRGNAADAVEMIPWILHGASAEETSRLLTAFPPAAAELYLAEWKPAYDAVSRW